MNKTKKNIRLFLVSNMYPSKKGIRYGIFIKRFEEGLLNDFYVIKIVLTKKENLISKFFGYIILYLKVFYLFIICRKSDIVYVHFPLYFSISLIPLTWRKTPLILNFHGGDALFQTPIKKVFKWFMGPIVQNAVKIVVPSHYYKTKVTDVYKLKRDDSIFVYPSGGVDSKIFNPYEKKEEMFVFGFVSNFIKAKGWKEFLKALSTLGCVKGQRRLKGIMVGDGIDKAKIEEEIKTLKLNVELMPNVSQKELAKVYSSFNVLIFPTYNESLGLVGIEAMMCGIPVIATRTGGPTDYIKEGYNGFLFERGNVDELVNKINKFQGLNEEEINEMKMHCIETSKSFESSIVNKKLITVLKSVHRGGRSC